MTVEINNTAKIKFKKKPVIKAAEAFLKLYQPEKKHLSIALVGPSAIKKLNKKYRQKDEATDVLAFCPKGEYPGEIVICGEQIKKQAKLYQKTFVEELIYILIHGLLHLKGYRDETEAGRKKMEKMGQEIIKKLG